jgi:chloride channel protein, CIC family
MGSFRGGPVFPAIFVGTVGGLLASHLPGFPEGAAVATVMAATVAAVLRLPLASVVIALTLTSSAGADATPLIIVAAAVSYIIVDVLEGRQGRSAVKAPTAADASSTPTPAMSGQASVSIAPRASSSSSA